MINFPRILVALFFAFNMASLYAAEPGVKQDAMLQQPHGFVVNLPASETRGILKGLAAHRTDLTRRSTAAAMQASDTEIGAKDAIIALLMPGGLIYLANKRQRHQRAEQELREISSQLTELQTDIEHFAWQTAAQSVALLK
jgi:hypothetical protein